MDSPAKSSATPVIEETEHTFVVIFSMTADQSCLSGLMRVTMEPPLASKELPESCDSMRQPGGEN